MYGFNEGAKCLLLSTENASQSEANQLILVLIG